MTLQLQMLGTGNAFAKTFYNNNAVIDNQGYRLLVDCGITAPRAMYELGIDLSTIDGIFISHIHADHMGGLEEVAFRMMYVHGRKPELFVPSKVAKPLWEHSLRGSLDNAAENITGLDGYFQVTEMEEGRIYPISDGLSLEIFPTLHVPGKPSYSLVLNGKLFYSADTQFNRPLLDHVHDELQCRYLLHECQLTNPGTVHTTLDELLTLPDEMQRKISLMHYGDDNNPPEAFAGKTGSMAFLRQHEIFHFDV